MLFVERGKGDEVVAWEGGGGVRVGMAARWHGCGMEGG